MTLTLDAPDDIEIEFEVHHQHGAKNTAREQLGSKPRTVYGPQKVRYPYYDFGPLLSRNAVYNFAVGGRGIGKTYGAKKLAIRAWIRSRDQFIYLRRHVEELKSRDQFFADIQHEFPEWEFRANGNQFEAAPVSTAEDKKRKWETMGYIIALSRGQQNKSIPYPLVKLIIFDEFILEKGLTHYIPDEATVMQNFYSTVDRGQDKTRVIFVANAVSMMNPYFIEYGIAPDEKVEFKTYAKNPLSGQPFICAHFPKSEEFAAMFFQTRFGQFIKDSDYAKYAVGNEFRDNRTDLVRPKNPRAKHQFNLLTKFGWISVWHDLVQNQFYVSRTLPANQREFTLVPEQMTKDRMLLFHNDDIVKRMRTGYRMARMEFDSPQAENIFLDVLNKR